MYRVVGGFWNTSVALGFNVNSTRIVFEALFSASLAKKNFVRKLKKKNNFKEVFVKFFHLFCNFF